MKTEVVQRLYLQPVVKASGHAQTGCGGMNYRMRDISFTNLQQYLKQRVCNSVHLI